MHVGMCEGSGKSLEDMLTKLYIISEAVLSQRLYSSKKTHIDRVYEHLYHAPLRFKKTHLDHLLKGVFHGHQIGTLAVFQLPL